MLKSVGLILSITVRNILKTFQLGETMAND